jgi:hypothetical protein
MTDPTRLPPSSTNPTSLPPRQLGMGRLLLAGLLSDAGAAVAGAVVGMIAFAKTQGEGKPVANPLVAGAVAGAVGSALAWLVTGLSYGLGARAAANWAAAICFPLVLFAAAGAGAGARSATKAGFIASVILFLAIGAAGTLWLIVSAVLRSGSAIGGMAGAAIGGALGSGWGVTGAIGGGLVGGLLGIVLGPKTKYPSLAPVGRMEDATGNGEGRPPPPQPLHPLGQALRAVERESGRRGSPAKPLPPLVGWVVFGGFLLLMAGLVLFFILR